MDCTVYTVQTIFIYTLLVCLFKTYKRDTGWTDRANIFCGTSRDPRKVYEWSKFQKFASKKIRFLKIKKILKILL